MRRQVAALALPERSEAELETRAERLFLRWESKDRPGKWEYANEQMKSHFRKLATLRAVA